MSKKIILSLGIIGIAAVAAIGGTIAYFSDTETSTGNTLTAGVLDLKVGNTCHYDGMICANGVWAEEVTGSSRYPELLNQTCACAWEPTELINQLYFNFNDVKPGDDGENTVSLQVGNNSSWACAEIKNLVSLENGQNEPEAAVDSTLDIGELQDNIYLDMWRDNNCDNKFNGNDVYLMQNTKMSDSQWPIADATTGGGPLSGGQTYCVAIAWRVPAEVGNIIQSDKLTGDIAFTAVQSRNNADFKCNQSAVANMGTVTINKVVVNNNGGTALASAWTLKVGDIVVGNGVSKDFIPAIYQIGEIGPVGYSAVYSGDCSAQGQLTIVAGQSYTCTITNTYNPSQRSIVLGENFGASGHNDIPNWEENDGTSAGTETRSASGTGNESASPDGDAFALANGNGGWFCRAIDASAYHSLELAYFWRGDQDANILSDVGVVEYKIGGTCADSSGWTALQNHDLQLDAAWTTQSALTLPSALNSTIFLLRFRNASDNVDKDFRVDGVSLTGLPN